MIEYIFWIYLGACCYSVLTAYRHKNELLAVSYIAIMILAGFGLHTLNRLDQIKDRLPEKPPAAAVQAGEVEVGP